jgi:hypothetical protein
MKLKERLNVLIQAITLSQKSGVISLDDAVKAKSAIDIIYSGVINSNLASAINILIEIIIYSQKKGIYSLKDAHMIYIAIEGIECELQNEASRINKELQLKESQKSQTIEKDIKNEHIISVPPKELKNNFN